eukprot:3920213-Rhodomonas_salina.1
MSGSNDRRYATSDSIELAYAMQCPVVLTSAMQCPVLTSVCCYQSCLVTLSAGTQRPLSACLSAYALALRCPVLTRAVLSRYARSGTNIRYRTTRVLRGVRY